MKKVKSFKKGALAITGIGLSIFALNALSNTNFNSTTAPQTFEEEANASSEMFFNGAEDNLKASEGNLVYEIKNVNGVNFIYAFDTSITNEDGSIDPVEIYNSVDGFNVMIFGSEHDDLLGNKEIVGFNFKQDIESNSAIISLLDKDGVTHFVKVELSSDLTSGTFNSFYSTNLGINPNSVVQFNNDSGELFTLIYEQNGDETELKMFDQNLNQIKFGGEKNELSGLALNGETTKVTPISNKQIGMFVWTMSDTPDESSFNDRFGKSTHFSQFIVETTSEKYVISLNFNENESYINSILIQKIGNIDFKLINDKLYITNGTQAIEIFGENDNIIDFPKDGEANNPEDNYLDKSKNTYGNYWDGSGVLSWATDADYNEKRNYLEINDTNYNGFTVNSETWEEGEKTLSAFELYNQYFTISNINSTYKLNAITIDTSTDTPIYSIESKYEVESDKTFENVDIKTTNDNCMIITTDQGTKVIHLTQVDGVPSVIENSLNFDVKFVETNDSIKISKDGVFGANVTLQFIDTDGELYNSLNSGNKSSTLKLINNNESVKSDNMVKSSLTNENGVTEVKYSFSGDSLGNHRLGGFKFDSIQLEYGIKPVQSKESISVNKLSKSYKLSTNGTAVVASSFTLLFAIILILVVLIVVNVKKNKKTKMARSSLNTSVENNNSNANKNVQEIKLEEPKKAEEIKIEEPKEEVKKETKETKTTSSKKEDTTKTTTKDKNDTTTTKK